MTLNHEQRYQIKALSDAGLQDKDIAKLVGISKGGLSKEFKRNGGRLNYDPRRADERASIQLHESHVYKKFSETTWDRVEEMILDDLSPEQVSGRMKLEGLEASQTFQATSAS